MKTVINGRDFHYPSHEEIQRFLASKGLIHAKEWLTGLDWGLLYQKLSQYPNRITPDNPIFPFVQQYLSGERTPELYEKIMKILDSFPSESPQSLILPHQNFIPRF